MGTPQGYFWGWFKENDLVVVAWSEDYQRRPAKNRHHKRWWQRRRQSNPA